MSLTSNTLRALVVATALLAATGQALAQDGQPDRFFSDKVSEAEEEGGEPDSVYQGSITSTSLVARESGKTIASEMGGQRQIIADNASPIDRLFTELRAQLDAKHLAGGKFHARLDGRVRLTSGCVFQSKTVQPVSPTAPENDQCRIQSGTFGDDEYDLRELYVKRNGEKVDFQVGRQYVLDLAATKIDGIRIDYQSSERVGLLAFGGLYPARSSRSVGEDYPRQMLPGAMEPGQRILPVSAGAGAVYRTQSLWGSFGGVGILPRGDQMVNGGVRAEPIRFFLTGNGYWRQSKKLDIYHNVVFDLQGSAGAGITNFSLGAHYRPTDTLRINASANQVDTETLNIIAQNRLEDVGVGVGGVGSVQNNFEVSRIASQSARVSVSSSFRDQRFEVSVSGQLRRREGIDWVQSNGMLSPQDLPPAKAAEIMLSVLDRNSYKDFRFRASVLRIFGFGVQSLYNSNATQVQLSGAREFKDGLGQYELTVSYLAAVDDAAANGCPLGAVLLDCYGTTKVSSLGLGGTAFYRFKLDWFLMGSLDLARQSFSSQTGLALLDDNDGANTLITGFLRLAYRF